MADPWEFPTSARALALHWALDSEPADVDTRSIIDRAELFFRFITDKLPVRLVLTLGPVVDQTTHTPQGTNGGGTGMAQLHDDQQLDVVVRAVDSKGFDVTDVDVAASSQDETVATVTEAEDGRTFTVLAGVPGSTIIDVTCGDLSATLAVDVKPGNVQLLQLNVGDPVAQPAAPVDNGGGDVPPAEEPTV